MKSVYTQFREPMGSLGWLVGLSMGLKNSDRSRWALGLLAPKPGEHILEIGFGSGADIARLLDEVAPTGTVTGMDASDVMVRMASRRNRPAVGGGRVHLERASVPDLPFGNARFDAAFSVNCAQFWPDVEAGLAAVGRVLRLGGRAVIAVQPKHRRARRADSERWLEKLTDAADRAELTVVARELGPGRVPTAAVALRKEQA